MNDRKRIDLLSRYLDDGLSADQEQALSAMLKSDEQARELFYHLSMQHALLHRLARTTASLPPGVEQDAVTAPDNARAARGRSPDAARSRTGAARTRIVRFPKRRSWRITAIAAALILAFGMMLNRQWDRLIGRDTAGRRPSVVELVGPASVQRGANRFSLTTGTMLRAGDQIVCAGAQSRLALGYADGTRIAVLGAGAVRLLPQPGRRLFLETGVLEAQIAPQPSVRPVILSTSHADVEVLGTQFALSATEQKTLLDLRTGRLRIACKRSGESIVLNAGSSAQIAKTIAVSASPLIRRRPGHITRHGPVLLYCFDEGSGTTVRDSSGVGPPLDLQIQDPQRTRWLPGGGLAVAGNTAIRSAGPALKLTRACKESNALSVEAWIKPVGPQMDGPARILTVSQGASARNFTLAQGGGAYYLRVQVSAVPPPSFNLCGGLGHIRPGLNHVVATRDGSGMCRLYVNGEQRKVGLEPHLFPAPEDLVHDRLEAPGTFSGWDERYPLMLANELNSADRNRSWRGEYHRVALYSRALSAEEVARNYRAGPTARSAARHAGVPD